MDLNEYMKAALSEAEKALKANEVPVGCVIADADGTIIGRGHNLSNTMKNSLYHAEIIAINEACKNLGDWRLSDCTLFVTVEPCPMCAGAIVMSRVKTVVFGAKNPKAGCAGSILDVLDEPRFNHRVNVMQGILSDECGKLMSDFFRKEIRKA